MVIKTVLITGANRGIGLEHVARFAASGAMVFAGVRNRSSADDLHRIAKKWPDTIVLFDYDALNPDAPTIAKATLKDIPLDLLFANAGVYGGEHQRLRDVAANDFVDTLRINTIAPLLLADALIDAVDASYRKIIAFQSSKMGSNTGSHSSSSYAYRSSKAALNKIASTLSNELRPRGVTVVSLHPGWVRTSMGGQNADISISECVDGQQAFLSSLSLDWSGGFYNYDGSPIGW